MTRLLRPLRFRSVLRAASLLMLLMAVGACGDDDGAGGDATGMAPVAVLKVLTPAPFWVGDSVLLEGSDSTQSGENLSVSWAIVEAPATSDASFTVVADPVGELTADVAGDYLVALVVSNEHGEDTAYALVSFREVPECISSTGCMWPLPVCDVAYGVCVECLTESDCAHHPGTTCSAGACSCPGGDDWCPPDQCVDLQTDSDHCGGCGHVCYGACVAGTCVDAWEPTSTVAAPAPRSRHVAVWAESVHRMIVWGGEVPGGQTNTGGMYDPDTWQWTPTSMVGAPAPRFFATAVWTGSEMIVWGGLSNSGPLGDGARFDPATNTWTPMATVGAPLARVGHTAVWTGDRMIVWGGVGEGNELFGGGVYFPATDTWSPMSAQTISRTNHSAVWADDQGLMLIYGGSGDNPGAGLVNVYFPTFSSPGGVAYDPGADQWTSLSGVGEPSARAGHSAIYDGTAMLVFGGNSSASFLENGASYEDGVWAAMAGQAPMGRSLHTAVWIPSVARMVIWGGVSSSSEYVSLGAEYDPALGLWIGDTPAAPTGRRDHTAVALSGRMIIWGGETASGLTNDGAVYTPTP